MQAEPHSFAEWRTTNGVQLTQGQVRALRDVFQATVQPAHSGAGFDVRPSNVVGTATVDDTVITVSPKISIDRVLFMIAYSGSPLTWREDWGALKGVDNLVDGMAHLFARSLERTFDQGLLRGYRTEAEDLRVVRGRVDFATQLKRRPGQALPISVRYSRYDENIPQNQVLLTAARVLARLPLSRGEVLSRLRQVTRDLSAVTPWVSGLPFPEVVWTRSNEYYRPAVALAELILQNRMVDVQQGRPPVPSFVVRLHTVFEHFVRRALRVAAGFSHDEFPQYAHKLPLDEAGLVATSPDLSWVDEQGWRFVGDVKYKRDTGSGKESDLYQVLAYAVATGLPDAALIYADGPPAGPVHRIRHTDICVHLHHIDLSADPWNVLQQIADIARIHDLGGTFPAAPVAVDA